MTGRFRRVNPYVASVCLCLLTYGTYSVTLFAFATATYQSEWPDCSSLCATRRTVWL